jgi:hypothetical protein
MVEAKGKAKPKRKSAGKNKAAKIPMQYQDKTRKGKFQIDGVVTLVPYANNTYAMTINRKPAAQDIGPYPAYRNPDLYKLQPNGKPYPKPKVNPALNYLNELKKLRQLTPEELEQWTKLTKPVEVAAGGMDPVANAASKVAEDVADVAVDAVAEII